ncbi:MAG: C_GCAxxG_C_C family protein [Lachnospiraceae bacterium]|nr:C_GCAxxG_C_C family protein [Lachnospiraceae bacterium]
MKDYEAIAKDLFKEGYNCSQAVLLAFAEECGLDEKTAAAVASSFGGGMGRLREVCGTVSGMFLAAGILYGYTEPKDYEGKKEHYARIQELAHTFKEKNGSIICRELLGLKDASLSPVPEKRTDEYYKKRPCMELAGCAAGILSEYMKTHPLSSK